MEINPTKAPNTKFSHPLITAKGERRAHVPFRKLDTLWLNTGTLCNLSCENCYIESSPKNDRLSYLTLGDTLPYLQEIQKENWPTKLIGLTGGEPFMNPYIHEIITAILDHDFEILILTNATKFIKRHREKIQQYAQNYPQKFHLRVSLDHYSKEIHEKERGEKTFQPTLENIQWFLQNSVRVSIAGRSLTHENPQDVEHGYRNLLQSLGLEQTKIQLGENLLLFPEMTPDKEVPEITTSCWGILNKTPDSVMCSNERMVVKRKGESQAKVLACTLLAYDPQFELGTTLKESFKAVSLNHSYCASFCVLGGGSCSAVK